MFIYLVKFYLLGEPGHPMLAVVTGRDAAQAGHCAKMAFYPYPDVKEIVCIGQRTEAQVAADSMDPFVIAQAYE